MNLNNPYLDQQREQIHVKEQHGPPSEVIGDLVGSGTTNNIAMFSATNGATVFNTNSGGTYCKVIRLTK